MGLIFLPARLVHTINQRLGPHGHDEPQENISIGRYGDSRDAEELCYNADVWKHGLGSEGYCGS